MLLSQEYFLERLLYNSNTGALLWIERRVTNKWDKIWNTNFAGKKAGCKDKRGRLIVCVGQRKYAAHRLIWYMVTGEWPFQIDHKDHDPSNNCWHNLREATGSQNQWNKRIQSNNTSGFKGVSFQKAAKKWCAFIKQHHQNYYLGLFDTPEEAHAAYRQAAHSFHEDFACIE